MPGRTEEKEREHRNLKGKIIVVVESEEQHRQLADHIASGVQDRGMDEGSRGGPIRRYESRKITYQKRERIKERQLIK